MKAIARIIFYLYLTIACVLIYAQLPVMINFIPGHFYGFDLSASILFVPILIAALDLYRWDKRKEKI